MTAELVFQTTSPLAIAWWENVRVRLEKDCLVRVALAEKLTAELGPGHSGGPRSLYVITTWDGADLVTGVEAVGNEWTEPPVGWRFDLKARHLVPAERSSAGREVTKGLQAASGLAWRADSASVGIPRHISALAAAGDESSRAVYEAGIFFDVERRVLRQLWGTAAVYDEVIAKQKDIRGVEWTEVSRVN